MRDDAERMTRDDERRREKDAAREREVLRDLFGVDTPQQLNRQQRRQVMRRTVTTHRVRRWGPM